tara:strand:+ start:3784 stop:5235 length:1452 start_codon:yes stop_codon:yes gene_type:complete
MNLLQEVILSLNKEESRYFKLYAKRTNVKAERKDLLLFDVIKKSDFIDEDRIAAKLYGENKNAFYRLKNRLLTDLNKSLLLQHINYDEDLSILQNLLLSRVFRRKQKNKVAEVYLKKAEKKAEQIEAYELLNLIYSELIKLSHDMISIDVEDYIEKKKINNERLRRIHEIDDVLAAVMFRIRSAQNFSGKNAAIIDLLEKTVKEYTQTENLEISDKLRIKIYQAVSRVLLQKHDYVALEEYLLHMLDLFMKKKVFNKSTHDIKLQMHTYLVNSLFKNKKLKESLAYTEKLNVAMNEYDGFLRDKFLFYYYNSLVINYSVLDKEKAIDILEEAKRNDYIKQLPTYTVFIYLNLCLLLFDTGKIKQSAKHLSRLCLHEDFLKIGRTFQAKIMMAEIIIRYELGDFDLLEKRIKQIKKDYDELFKKEQFSREVLLMDIVSELIYTPSIKSNQELSEKIIHLIDSMSADDADDADVINYHTWAKSKL